MENEARERKFIKEIKINLYYRIYKLYPMLYKILKIIFLDDSLFHRKLGQKLTLLIIIA